MFTRNRRATLELRTVTTECGYYQYRAHTVTLPNGTALDFDGSARGKRAAASYVKSFNATHDLTAAWYAADCPPVAPYATR